MFGAKRSTPAQQQEAPIGILVVSPVRRKRIRTASGRAALLPLALPSPSSRPSSRALVTFGTSPSPDNKRLTSFLEEAESYCYKSSVYGSTTNDSRIATWWPILQCPFLYASLPLCVVVVVVVVCCAVWQVLRPSGTGTRKNQPRNPVQTRLY